MNRAVALFFFLQLLTSCHQTVAQLCGGTLTNSTGVITSPNHPSDYNNNDSCTWVILMPSTYTGLYLGFTAFNTSSFYDFVEIRNGNSSTGYLFGRYSGTVIPPATVTTSNSLWIRFTSDSLETRSGFRAEWSPRAAVCGGTYTTSTGVITSPNYPSNYNDYDYCLWIIRMPLSYFGISLNFTAFDTQLNYDILEIRNGDTSSSPLINQYSGSTIPATVSITGNNMWIQFKSDGSITYSGFRAEWSMKACSGTYTTSTGVIMSPNHPSDYNNNDNCTLIIRMPSVYWHSGISLRFTAFNTQLDNDILEIRDGNTSSAPLVNRYSGSTIPAIVSLPGSNMWLQFTSDGSITYSGFRAQWSPRTYACDGNYTTTSGSIFSPNYPFNYNNNDNCVWIIRTPAAYSGISLRFVNFRTELNRDILEIRDGDTSSSPLVNRYSGYTIPPTISIDGNNMWLQFTSNGSITHSGFHLQWSSVCGGHFNSSRGVITSPNYPSNYNNNDFCVWIIRMPPKYDGITLTFTAFNTELSYDYVQIRSGDNQYGSIVGTYSGSSKPSPVSIHENSMWILFLSDSSFTRSGFRAEWSPRKSSSSSTVFLIICVCVGVMVAIVLLGMFIKACKKTKSPVGAALSHSTPPEDHMPPPGTYRATPPPPYSPPYSTPGAHLATSPPPYIPPQQETTNVYDVIS